MLQSELKKSGPQIEAPSSGFEAAGATVGLMRGRLGESSRATSSTRFHPGQDLWDQFGEATVGADCRRRTHVAGDLGRRLGGGRRRPDGAGIAEAGEHKTLMDLYLCKTWMPR